MGRFNNVRIILMIICLTVCSFIIYFQPETSAINKTKSLKSFFSSIKGWAVTSENQLEFDVLKALDLDEYLFQSYSNGNDYVSLYIGYYYTLKKVGAAHSPLVCFSGQGWKVVDISNGTHLVSNKKIHYSSIIVEKAGKKELILYWFQSFNKTSSGTFFQKIFVAWDKYMYSKEDNAFVRVAIPFEGNKKADAFSKGIKFIDSFYPEFIKYINQ